MDSPSSALIGIAGMSIGALILYGAYKNVSVFGSNGIVGATLANGAIPDVNTLPKLFGPTGVGVLGQTTLGGAEEALTTIGKTDPTLAAQLQSELVKWSATGTPTGGTAKLKSLVSSARTKGFAAEADAIQAYINAPDNPFAGASAPASSSTGGSTFT